MGVETVGITTIYINGSEFHGITDFEFSSDDPDFYDYLKDHTVIKIDDSMELTCECKVRMIELFKISGLWSWVSENCPNKRVVHLMKYGKNERTRVKNFYHAYKDISKLLRKGDYLWV